MTSPMRDSGFPEGHAILQLIVDELEGGPLPDEAALLAPAERDARYQMATDAPTSVPPTWLDRRLRVGGAVATCALLAVVMCAGIVTSTAGRWPVFAGWTFVMIVLLVRWSPKRASQEYTATLGERHGFPITGFASWAVCDVPLAEIEFATTVDVRLFERALRAIEPSTLVEVRNSRTIRFALPACTTRTGRRYGNVLLLRRVIETLLVPLDVEIGVERLALGGTVEAAR